MYTFFCIIQYLDFYWEKNETEKTTQITENLPTENLEQLQVDANFADEGNTNILNITQDEYTDEFRRIQETSRNLSDEEIAAYHRGAEYGGKLYPDKERRLLGTAYGRLLSRGDSLRNGSWITLVHTDRKGQDRQFRLTQVNGSLFHDIFEINRKYLQYGELVDLHDDYSNARCYLTEDGLSGFAIESNGNVV